MLPDPPIEYSNGKNNRPRKVLSKSMSIFLSGNIYTNLWIKWICDH
jgi:hypothetical protein